MCQSLVGGESNLGQVAMEAQLTGNLQMMERSQVPLYRILCLSSVGAIELATGAEEET